MAVLADFFQYYGLAEAGHVGVIAHTFSAPPGMVCIGDTGDVFIGGGIGGAAAVHNVGEEAIVVTCRLMKDRAVLEEVEIPLEANGQEASFIEEVFPTTATSDFVGLVRCTAPEGELFTGVAVEERMDRE